MMFIRKSLIVIVCCIGLCLSVGVNCVPANAQEYTDDEKNQAKAWLSAHGYAPTQAGAEQAYQDYLNGKFDEELKGNPAAAAAASQSAPTTEGAATEATVDLDKQTSEESKGNAIEGSDRNQTQDTSTEKVTTEIATTESVDDTKNSDEENGVEPIRIEPREATKEKSWKLVLAIGIISLLVLLGIIIYVYRKNKGNKDE